MSNVEDIGALEGRMCGHLAASLCVLFAGQGSNGAGQKGHGIEPYSGGDWEAAERALLDVGVMHLEPIENHGGRVVFSMNAEQMPDFLAASIRNGDPLVSPLIQSFVAIACGYGQPILSAERDWFDPPPRFALAMKWLARHGYAERHEGAFRWTDKIGPAMRASDCWSEDNLSCTTLERARLEAECDLIWATMPDTLRQAIVSRRVGVMDLTKVLALGWKDGRWRAFRNDDPVELSGQVPLARRIIERLEQAD